MKIQLFYTVFMLFFIIPCIEAQSFQRIADINPGPNGSFFDDLGRPIEYDGNLLFTANDGTHGHELWIYDGSTATLLKDIYPGSESSEPQNFYIMNGMVLFNATDSLHGTEWWITDGTTDGTQLLIDIFPGPDHGVYAGISPDRRYQTVYNGEIYFSGAHRLNDFELWKTDGTAAGTVLVKNISSDNTSFNSPSYPSHYAEHQGTLYFSSHRGLWKTDGTTAGTELVREDDPDSPFRINPYDLISNDNYLIFLHDQNLWRSDGTMDGTYKIKDLESVNLNWSGHRFTRIGNIVLFPGDDGVHGDELWRSDGTTEGTHMVVDLIEGEEGYSPQNNVLYKNKMYYKGDNGETGIEFWRTDGTEAGTQLVKDIDPGTDAGFYLPTTIFTDGELIYMNAGAAFQKELWVSDGTTGGTFQIDINPNGQSRPTTFGKFGDKLFIFAYTDAYGFEPYLVDAMQTSNEEITADSPIRFYPNPANGILHISSPPGMNLKHALYDLKGNVFIGNITSSTMDISGIPGGTYILLSTDTEKGVGYFGKVVVVD